MNADLSGGGARQSQWIKAVGRNPSVASSAVEDLWDAGTTYSYLATASVLEIISNSVNDTAAGTGVRTVRVYGLDANWDFQVVDVTLNGTSAVDLTGTWMRVWRMRALTVGSGLGAAGTITLRVDGGGATVSVMQLTHTTSHMAMFTVPRKHTFALTQWHAGFGPDVILLTSNLPVASYGKMQLMVRFEGGDFAEEDEMPLFAQQPNGRERIYTRPLIIPAKADVKLRYTSVADIADEAVAGFFEGYLQSA